MLISVGQYPAHRARAQNALCKAYARYPESKSESVETFLCHLESAAIGCVSYEGTASSGKDEEGIRAVAESKLKGALHMFQNKSVVKEITSGDLLPRYLLAMCRLENQEDIKIQATSSYL